jgi:hypothetical protein
VLVVAAHAAHLDVSPSVGGPGPAPMPYRGRAEAPDQAGRLHLARRSGGPAVHLGGRLSGRTDRARPPWSARSQRRQPHVGDLRGERREEVGDTLDVVRDPAFPSEHGRSSQHETVDSGRIPRVGPANAR